MKVTIYSTIWRSKFITEGADSIDEMIEMLEDAAGNLKHMKADGVYLQSKVEDDYADLAIDYSEIAAKYGFEHELVLGEEEVVYECGCEVREDGVVFPCEEAKGIFDEEDTQEKLDKHYEGQNCKPL